ncbi:MAG: metallophosphoesterase [Faecalimonas sp.]|nr:metallophosphoesterase [Faecalimonas sp.]
MKVLLWVLAGIVVLVFAECIREVNSFRVTRYRISSPKLQRVKRRKMILLSDLHNCSYGKKNAALLRAIRKEQPDLILVAGDMLVGSKKKSPRVAEELMKELPKVCDTFCANGNHEQRYRNHQEVVDMDYKTYKKQLTDAGVHYLENEQASLMWEDCKVQIYGLEIPNEAYNKFQQTSLPNGYMEETLGAAEASAYTILIAHNPVYMEEYLNWGADLIVSGHFHGGIARIPFWRGVITPQGGLFPKYSGEHTKVGNQDVVVSKGIGIHTFKIRFLNPAEVVVLEVGDSEE